MSDAVEQVVAAPEHSNDLGRLVDAVTAKGWTYSTSGDNLTVDIGASQSAELDRAAHEAGLTLRILTPRHDDLEDVFLRMTGSTDTELAVDRAGQRHTEETS